jgi:hypothetical protein
MGALVMTEHMEAFFRGARGAKGDKGDRGDKGQRGLPQGQARAIVYLFAVCIVLFIVLGLGLFHYVHASQAAQRRQGAVVGEKLCATFGSLAALRPPAGSASANPSRAYEQQLHAELVQLGDDLGCKGK